MEEATGTPRVLIRGILQGDPRQQPQKTPVDSAGEQHAPSENMRRNTKTQADLLRDRRKSLLQRKVSVGKTPRNMIKGFLKTEGIQRPRVAQTPKLPSVRSKEQDNGLEESALACDGSAKKVQKGDARPRHTAIMASDLFKSILAGDSPSKALNVSAPETTSSFIASTHSSPGILDKEVISNRVNLDQDFDPEHFEAESVSDTNDGASLVAVTQDSCQVETVERPLQSAASCAPGQSATDALPADDKVETDQRHVLKSKKKLGLIVGGEKDRVNSGEERLTNDTADALQAPSFPLRTTKKVFKSLLRTCNPVSKCSASSAAALESVTAQFFQQAAGDLKSIALERSHKKPKVTLKDVETLLTQQGYITDTTSMEDLIRHLLTREYSDELLDLSTR